MSMLTPEETRVLGYLQKHTFSPMPDVLRRCFPGAPVEWAKRVIANLEWLNNLTVFYDRGGEALALQLTEKGLALARTLRAASAG
jgi:hypothetical protein